MWMLRDESLRGLARVVVSIVWCSQKRDNVYCDPYPFSASPGPISELVLLAPNTSIVRKVKSNGTQEFCLLITN